MLKKRMNRPDRGGIDLAVLIEGISALSLQGRREFLRWLRTGSRKLSAEDNHALVRIADALDLLLG